MASQRFSRILAPLRDPDRRATVLICLVWGMLGGRLLAELGAQPLRLRWILVIIATSAVVGILAGICLAPKVRLSWWMLIPGLYLIWPWSQPLVALLLVGTWLAIVGIPRINTLRAWPETMVAAAFLMLYALTLAPGLLPADSGEFQLVAATLGIAHPPGYALYTMLGRLATLVPLGCPAQRLNAMSGLAAAGSLFVLMRAIRKQGGSPSASLAPALMLGLAATYWAQATTANIRSLTALFTALSLATLLHWEQTREDRWLTLFALCYGLGVGHHASLGLLGPPLLAFILFTDPRLIREPRRWPVPVATLLATFLVWLYLPIRSAMSPAFDPSPIADWAGFWQHVLALGFGGDMFRYRTWDVLQPRLGVWVEIMRLEFGAVLPVISAMAAALVAKRRWRVALLIVGAWFMNAMSAITYRAPQTVEYLMPSYVAMAFALGLGLIEVERWPRVQRRLAPALVMIVCLMALAPAAENWRSFRTVHCDDSTRQAAQAMLDAAPPNTTILSSWHHATPMWYLQLVEEQRTDVTVTYVYPEGGTPNAEVWLRRIDEALDAGTVIVTNRYHAYRDTDLVWTPLAQGWQAHRDAPTEMPAAATANRSLLSDQIALVGHETSASVVMPGDSLSVIVYWAPQEPLERDYTSFCQLVGPSGVLGQADLHHTADAFAPGEICADSFRLSILPHAASGEYQLIVGFYAIKDGTPERLMTDESDHVVLGQVSVTPLTTRPVSLYPHRDRWECGLELVSADFDMGVAGQTRVYLHWRGPVEENDLPIVQLLFDGAPSSQATLPRLARDQYHTVALDVPDTVTEVGLLLVIDGVPAARLGPWNRDLRKPVLLRVPSSDARYVPLGGEMALIQAGLPNHVAQAQEAWFQPRLLTLRPLSKDYSMSLGLVGEGWEVKSDGTPALGAIPTLKWVRGWQVTDPRKVTVPTDTAGQEAIVTLSVYDAFTLEPVPILDERLVRQGQGVTLELGQVSVVR